MTGTLTEAVDRAVPVAPRIRRSRRATLYSGVALSAAVIALAYLPFVAYTTVTNALITFFVLLALATSWNLLAGYAGLVSVGQQAYLGLGAYALLQLSDWGVHPYLAIPLAGLVCAVIAVPTSLLAFRLRGDYFAVGTWVIAEVYRLLVVRVDAWGGGSGRSLTTLSGMDLVVRQAMTYWAALGVAVAALLGSYLLLRSRLGLALTAVRDDETAARSVGVNVSRAKRVAYLVSAAGCGAVGGLVLVSTLNVRPDAVFNVQWSAYMIFIVVIGGVGSLEGPLLGTVVFFALQQLLADYGAWYLALLGAVAIAAAVWAPRGLWGLATRSSGWHLFPVGYVVAPPRRR